MLDNRCTIPHLPRAPPGPASEARGAQRAPALEPLLRHARRHTALGMSTQHANPTQCSLHTGAPRLLVSYTGGPDIDAVAAVACTSGVRSGARARKPVCAVNHAAGGRALSRLLCGYCCACSDDSGADAGLWRGTSVAVSVVSMRLGPRSCQRVLGTERIVAVNLDHPNVVTTYVYDSVEPADAGASGAAGRGSTRAYAVQELCNGGSLQSALLRGVLAPGVLRPRWPSILRILCGVAAGMDYMHRLRVFHGALMPSNILFKVRPSLHNTRACMGVMYTSHGVHPSLFLTS